jgi:hypothetical protein
MIRALAAALLASLAVAAEPQAAGGGVVATGGGAYAGGDGAVANGHAVGAGPGAPNQNQGTTSGQAVAESHVGLVNTQWSIRILMNEDDQASSLAFGLDDAECGWIRSRWGLEKFRYEQKDAGFSGSGRGSKGETIEVSGQIDGNRISGTIVVTPQVGSSHSYRFRGGRTGTDAAP